MPTAASSVNSNVGSVMSKKLSTVQPGMSLMAAMEVMVSQEIGHLPVVDGEGKLLGILSKTDLVRENHLAGGDNEENATVRVPAKKGVSYALGAGFHEDQESKRTVADAMTTKVITVGEQTSLAQAALLMVNNRIHGLPVVSPTKKLVGFLSTMDIVEWVARN